MQTQEPLTCESLKKQYQVLQDIADEYKALLINEGTTSEKIKELRTTFDTKTENLRNNIVIYKEKQEGIFYLSAEYRSGEEYIKVLEEKGYEVDTSPKFFLTQLTNIPKEQVRLKKVTPEDFGFPGDYTVEEILAVAKKHNLKPCPPWVGPQYRLEYNDDKYAAIGMKPLTDSYDEYVINVHASDKRRLTGIPTNSYFYPTDRGEWIFASPK